MGIPPTIEDTYNQRLPGVYGQFGSGAGVHAFYLQSALSPVQLDWVSLISDIRGSECWPLRELFQRDVDNERITTQLLPYLQNPDRIKFFNPLTLTLLPVQENEVLTQMPRVVESTREDSGRQWRVLEREGYHCVRWVLDEEQYALLEWHDTRTKLVAIDGQHRLSALKRFWKDHASPLHQDFKTWRIPVVIVSFRAEQEREKPPTVLEVVRSIFVYINTEAKPVSPARGILLSDESINKVCTQELIQRAHNNDLATGSDHDPGVWPLLLYNWREEEDVNGRAALEVAEICNWFEYYLLGEDFKDEQETALGCDAGHPLHRAFHRERLTHAESDVARQLAQERVLPAVWHLLENFGPYASYVQALRELERRYENEEQSDLARHAFHELRFGTNLAPDANREEVERLLDGIKVEIKELKGKFVGSPIDLDIGMRGVMCAFGALRWSFGNPDWIAYAAWFTDALNQLYGEGWLDLAPRARRRESLRHIVEDHNDTIVNYRLSDAENALGAYVQLLVLAYGGTTLEGCSVDMGALKEELREKLRSRVARGYRKQVRPQLKTQFPDGGSPLTEAVSRGAEELAEEQMAKLEAAMRRIEGRGRAAAR